MRNERKTNAGKRKDSMAFWVFAAIVILTFGYMIYGAYRLQIVNGESYAESADASGTKSIPIKGMRGMIVDVNSVILAKSEVSYELTFQRTSEENSSADYGEFTQSILSVLRILEDYGCELSVTQPLFHNPESGLWELNFGTGVSESVLKTRENQWRSNHYLTSSAYENPENCYVRLCQRYRLADSANGSVKAIATVDEETSLKVLAVYNEMQMNLFNSVPVTIAKDIPYDAVTRIESNSLSMRGMGIRVGEKRIYPQGSLASNIIGYTGAIQNAQRYYNELQPQGYAMNDHIGLDGIESSMESWLTACITDRQGSRLVEKDSNGKITRELDYTEPEDGNTVKLTLDVNMQRVAEKAIANNVNAVRDLQETTMNKGNWLETNRLKIESRDWVEYPIKLASTGVLLVMDVETGSLLADAQYPTYDLNAMITGGKAAQEVVTDERNLLMNYSVQTRAEPGSIFKMVTGLAALTNSAVTGFTVESRISDEGKFMGYTKNENEAPTCWTNYPNQHRDQTIVEGLSHSCNFFFYTLASYLYGTNGSELNSQQLLYKYAAKMGLTSKTGIQLPGELRSIVGNQQNLYDTTVAMREQVTDTPIIVANAIKRHLINYGASYGIAYDEARLDRTIKQLMDMAINTPSDDWVVNARPILMSELNMTRTMVMQAALMSDLWIYLNTIKWGGSQEIQVAIGQSITLLTPVAVVRYLGALAYGDVWNVNIIDSIISPEGEVMSAYAPSKFNHLTDAEPYLYYIQKGMEGVVDDGGTAQSYFRTWKYTASEWIMGKTGTSQVTIGGIKLDLENNAWFICLAPQEHPKIAVVSFIPNGYAGSHATQAVRDFVGWYLDELNKTDATLRLPGGNQLTP